MDFLVSAMMTIAGIFIGAVSVTAGSSSLITIPLLLSLGLNPYAAIATNKFSVLSSFVAGGMKYHKEKFIRNRKFIFLASVAAIIGSATGANIVLNIDQSILKTIIILLLSAVLLISAFKKDEIKAAKKLRLTPLTYTYAFFVVFLLGIYGGFFGTGLGTFIIFSMVYLFGFTYLESSAMMTVVNFFALIVPVIIFAFNNIIDYSIGLPLLAGNAIGGWLGAHYAIIKGSRIIRKLFIAISATLILKLLIESLSEVLL